MNRLQRIFLLGILMSPVWAMLLAAKFLSDSLRILSGEAWIYFEEE